MKYFISDTHFLHFNVIKYSNRPFKDVDDMTIQLISNWNEVVSKTDEVYILGDFCFGTKAKWRIILNQLNGIKYYIKGNHDKPKQIPTEMFEWVKDYHELNLKINDKWKKIVLCHYPFLTWNKNHSGSWNLFGHAHGNLNNISLKDRFKVFLGLKRKLSKNQYDVGVDCNNYKPISLDQIIEKLKQ